MNTDLVVSPEFTKELSVEERDKIENYKKNIDLTNSNQIVQFGNSAQNRLTSFADATLQNVRSRDMGQIGDLLVDLTLDLKSFDTAVNKKGFMGMFNNIKKKIAHLQIEYSKVEKNIGTIEVQLSKHSQSLSKDIFIFDEQYKENWNYYREISLYIQAGEEKIREMQEEILPNMRVQVEQSKDPQEVQKYNDLEQQLTRFEKKVHDLKLSRMISVQLAPQIRLVQNNSITMIDKIQSTIANTLPLWKNQMVLALGIAHTQQAVEAQKAVTDATNEMLKRNSEMLKQTTTAIATESERGIVDMETIKKANTDLFATLDDLVRIQTEGRQKRLAAEVELKAIEEELKTRLLNQRNPNNQY